MLGPLVVSAPSHARTGTPLASSSEGREDVGDFVQYSEPRDHARGLHRRRMNHELARTEIWILLYRDPTTEQQPPRQVEIDVGMKLDQVVAVGDGRIVPGNQRADLVGGPNRRHVAHAQVTEGDAPVARDQ